jgi:hypothetical protein
MMLRSTLLAVILSAAVPTMVLAQTSDDLKNDEKTTGDVLVYGKGYSAQRYSPLTLINKQNVNRLVPLWGYSLAAKTEIRPPAFSNPATEGQTRPVPEIEGGGGLSLVTLQRAADLGGPALRSLMEGKQTCRGHAKVDANGPRPYVRAAAHDRSGFQPHQRDRLSRYDAFS